MSEMTSTAIDGSMRVVYPASWAVLNPENACESSHACVLSCPKAASQGFPSEYLYFSNKPCSDFDETETDRLYGLVENEWPQFHQIRFEEEGLLEDHFNAPSLGADKRIDVGLDLFASEHKIVGSLFRKLKAKIGDGGEMSPQFEQTWKELTGTNGGAVDQAILASLGEDPKHIIVEIPLKGQKPTFSPKALSAYIDEDAREGGRQD